MTKQHFDLIARVLSSVSLVRKDRETLANEFANEFEKANECFNRERFLSACGV